MIFPKISFCFSFKIALRYFLSKSDEKFISLTSKLSTISIALGVFSLLIIIAFMDAMKSELIHTIIKTNGEIIVKTNSDKENHLASHQVSKLNFVKNCYYQSVASCIHVTCNDSHPVYLVGMTPEMLWQFSQINLQCTDTKIIPVIIDHTFANNFNIKKNALIKLISNKNTSDQYLTCKVLDIIEAKQLEEVKFACDKNNIFTSNQNVENQCLGAHILQVHTNNPTHLNKLDKKINSINNVLKDISHQIFSWKDGNQNLMNAVKVEKNCMILILSLIITLSSFIMTSSLFMLVKDKIQEIAILRIIGATKIDIMTIFMLHGLLSSCIGIVSGASCAFLLIKKFTSIKQFFHQYNNIAIINLFNDFFDHIQLQISYKGFVYVCCATLMLILLAIIYPASKAAGCSYTRILK